MTQLYKKKDNGRPRTTRQHSPSTAWDVIRQTANDNSPPVIFWFYKVLIFSLITFGIFQLLSFFLKI